MQTYGSAVWRGGITAQQSSALPLYKIGAKRQTRRI